MKVYKIRFKIVIALFVVIIILMPQLVRAESTEFDSRGIYCTVGIEHIKVLNINNERYLFLPAEADTTSLQLYSDSPGISVFWSVNNEILDALNLNELQAEDGTYSASFQMYDSDNDILGGPLKLIIIKGTNTGTIYYHSSDKVDQSREYIDESKTNHSTGTALIFGADKEIKYNGSIDDIHARGNSTFKDPKKSYQIKLAKKTALIKNTGKAKKWILLAQYKDVLKANDKLLKDIAVDASSEYGRYSPREEPVNLYYDGEYRGLYLLSEKNEIGVTRININDMEDDYDKNNSTYGENIDIRYVTNKYGNTYYYQYGLNDVDRQGGYLLEINSNNGDEYNWFRFNIAGRQMAMNIKSPELGSRKAVSFISEYFQEFCDAVSNNSGIDAGKNPDTGLYYYDYCDLDSLVDAYMLQEISSNYDAFRRSQYFYKDTGQKMYAGPLWDCDLIFGLGLVNSIDANISALLFKPLASDLISLPSFRFIAKQKYEEFYRPILERMLANEEEPLSLRNFVEKMRTDLNMDLVLWSEGYGIRQKSNKKLRNEYINEVLEDRLKWLRDHKTFLDSYYANLEADERESHIFADAVPMTEKSHTRTCTLHTDEVITETCKFKLDVIVEPTENSDGIVTYTCYSCGNRYSETVSAGTEIVDNNDESGNISGRIPGGNNGSGGGGGGGAIIAEPTDADIAVASTVINSIDDIPVENEISISDVEAIASARSLYENLTSIQKSVVEYSVVDKLNKAETAIAKIIIDTVNALPNPVTLENESEILVAMSAYNTLTETQKIQIPGGIIDKLTKSSEIIRAWKDYNAAVQTAKMETVKSARSKALKGRKAQIRWKKNAKASGYIVQCSTNKEFKKSVKSKSLKGNSKTKTVIKGLKRGNIYYVRIRPITKVKNAATGNNVSIKGNWARAGRIKQAK